MLKTDEQSPEITKRHGVLFDFFLILNKSRHIHYSKIAQNLST